jgi:hypothetical protein
MIFNGEIYNERLGINLKMFIVIENRIIHIFLILLLFCVAL